ncbi:MAG: hypothetical protein HY290_22970 [Planctomycetia bacterium]|nr:hypothetical protein [Planctomycetia bacterium]
MVAGKNSLYACGARWLCSFDPIKRGQVHLINGPVPFLFFLFLALIASVAIAMLPFGRLCAQAAAIDLSDDDEIVVEEDGGIEDEADVEQLVPEIGGQNAAIADQIVDNMVFGITGVAPDSPASNRVLALLEQKFDVVDAVCRLSDLQKRKLSLAGRRDIQRLFRRVEELRQGIKNSDAANPDVDWQAAWEPRASELRDELSNGPFSEDSLFAKVLNHTLTPDQSARYEALGVIRRAGGEISVCRRGPDQSAVVVEVDLTGTAFNDEDARCLKNFPSLESVDLRGTRITDAGVKQLTVLKELKRLVLNRTSITDSSRTALRSFAKLQDLIVVDAGISEAALAEIQQARPDLKIVKTERNSRSR